MGLSITVGGESVPLLVGSAPRVEDTLGERSTASFVVKDVDSTLAYQRGQPVRITDDADDTLVFAGYVDSATTSRIAPGGSRTHKLKCVDNTYLADKRVAAASYVDTAAGDIVADLIDQYLHAEGVRNDAAIQWDGTMAMKNPIDSPGTPNTVRIRMRMASPPTDTDSYLCWLWKNGCVMYVAQSTGYLTTHAPKVSSDLNVADGQPHWCTRIDDGTTMSLYVNGALVGSHASAPSQYGDARHHWFSFWNGASKSFSGDILEVQVYDVALTAAQEARLGSARTGHLVDGLTCLWLMDEGSGTTLHDLSGDDNDATLPDSGVAWIDQTVQAGPTIHETVINYRLVSEAMDKLADLADYHWWIDHNRVLHFAPGDALPAPWELTGDNVRDGNASVQRGNAQYRNRQYVRGGTDVTDSQTETRMGDGATQAWAMSYPLASAPTVTVDGEAQTVGVKGTESGKHWYWSKGDAVVSQETSATPLSSANTLSVTYQGQFAIVAVSGNQAAVDERQSVEGDTSGIVESIDDEPDISSRDAAFQKANALLKRYGAIGRTLKFRTKRSGLTPGQLLTATLPPLGLGGEQMLVTGVTTQAEGADILWRDVTAVEGPDTGTWVQMFRTLATRGQTYVPKVNIGKDEILAVLTQSSESWPWIEDVSQTARTCAVPAADLYPSATLYPC